MTTDGWRPLSDGLLAHEWALGIVFGMASRGEMRRLPGTLDDFLYAAPILAEFYQDIREHVWAALDRDTQTTIAFDEPTEEQRALRILPNLTFTTQLFGRVL